MLVGTMPHCKRVQQPGQKYSRNTTGTATNSDGSVTTLGPAAEVAVFRTAKDRPASVLPRSLVQ